MDNNYNVPYPMNLLTRPTGSSGSNGSSGLRKLIVHPKAIVDRENIRGTEIVVGSKCYCTTEISKLHIEHKSAGHRYFICRLLNGDYVMFGRRQNVLMKYTNIMPKLLERGFKFPEIPPNSCLDGELTWPGHPDSSVSTAIKECPEELSYVTFGLPIYKGKSIINTNTDYETTREECLKVSGNVIKTYMIDLRGLTTLNALSKLLKEIKKLQIEGFVLKEYAYKGWWKLKGNMEMDVFCTGVKISDSVTRNGMVTALQMGVLNDKGEIIDLGSASGLNFLMMEELTKYYEKNGLRKFKYRCFRVVYQERASQGGLKHASFDGWRDDKNYKECIL